MIEAGAKQKTIRREGEVSGAGLFTGAACKVFLKPAKADSGIIFFRNGSRVAAPGRGDNDLFSEPKVRCSWVGNDKDRIITVEHLLAAVAGLGITNIHLEVEGPEIPALDGSAAPFVRVLKELGIVEQAGEKEIYKIKEPIFCYEKTSALCVYPADEMSIACTLDYPHPYLHNQRVDFAVTPEIFEKEIAPARTFCTEKDAEELPKQGLGLGADEKNTLVVREDGSHQKTMRFPDECARHKVLDLLGDLALLGFPIRGRIVGLRSGHALNRRLVHEIKKRRNL